MKLKVVVPEAPCRTLENPALDVRDWRAWEALAAWSTPSAARWRNGAHSRRWAGARRPRVYDGLCLGNPRAGRQIPVDDGQGRVRQGGVARLNLVTSMSIGHDKMVSSAAFDTYPVDVHHLAAEPT